MQFLNRIEAGKQLARELISYKNKYSVVLALPRGGVVLGLEVARLLGASLGLVLVKKIGHPSYSEYAIGAIAEDQQPIYNKNEAQLLERTWMKKTEEEVYSLINKRRDFYYGKDFMNPDIKDRTVILVDDGIATGLTMQAAIKFVKTRSPRSVIVAVPVAPPDSVALLKKMADKVVVLDDPAHFLGSVSSHYQEFDQVSDDEVKTLLRKSKIRTYGPS